jgi:CheY-like chemotaxis protein
LVAEDNRTNQRLAQLTLEKQGCQVDLVSNGEEALERLAGASYDLILMDCQMPQVDGYEAAAEVRRREAGKRRTPIVAMTAGAMPGDRERCFAAGMDGFLVKPVRQRELTQILRDLTGAAPPAVPSEPPSAPASELDRSKLLAYGNGDPNFLRSFVELYLQEAPKLVSALREALARGDAEAISRAAHKLRGEISVFGAVRATEAAHRLERSAREGSLTGAGETLALLEAELGRLEAALKDLANKDLP